jgi:hypothetical protein
MNKQFLWVVAALSAVGVAGLYLQQRNGVATEPAAVAELPPEPMNEPQPIIRDEPTIEPVAGAPVVEQVPLPALSESDDEARETASELASKLAAWLKTTEQIRTWVVAIDLAAGGVLVEKNRPLALRCPSNFTFQQVAFMPPWIAEPHAC